MFIFDVQYGLSDDPSTLSSSSISVFSSIQENEELSSRKVSVLSLGALSLPHWMENRSLPTPFGEALSGLFLPGALL